MSSEAPYLLDTNVLMVLLRGKELGRYIDTTYRLRDRLNRHLICVVTHGEIWTLAGFSDWGEKKRDALRSMLDSVVTVDINDQAVFDAYVSLKKAARAHPLGSQANLGENDIWIAATARAAQAILITTDQHFDQFHPHLIERIYVPQTSRLVSDLPS